VILGATSVLGAGFFFAACAGDDTLVIPHDAGATHDASFALDASSAADAHDATMPMIEAGADAAHDASTASDAGGDGAAVDASDASMEMDASDASTPVDASSDAAVVDASDASTTNCLAGSGADAFFTIKDTTKCVVAAYTVPAASLATLTWGSHKGPLGFESSPLDVVRYSVPAAPTGTLTATRTTLNVSGLPAGIFWGSQALDLPFFPTLGWTAVAYTGMGTGFPGEVVIVDGTGAVAARYFVNGFFSEGSLGMAATSGRLLYTGLSPIGTTMTMTNMGGLYAADSCGTDAMSPRLVPAGDATCTAPFQVDTWQSGSSGPVTTDADGNAFAILSTFGGNQEMRGFEHDKIARGGAAIAGTTFFSMTGYTTELAADGSATYFQSNDPNTFTPVDVQSVAYTVDGTAHTITPSGAPTTFLAMVNPGTAAALIVDDARRLWVGVANPKADAGPATSTFFVIDTAK
jgi:hypothetical protein